MCLSRVTRLVTRQTKALSPDYTTVLQGEWLILYGSSTLRVMDELRARSGDFEQVVRYRLATARTDRPGPWINVGTSRTGDGAGTQVVDVSKISDKLWIQPALAGRAAAGVGEGLSSLQASLNASSQVVVSQTLQIQPSTNAQQMSVVPLGVPIPADGLKGIMAGFIISGVHGSLDFGLQFRTFPTGMSSPGPWGSIFSSSTAQATEVNTGDILLNPGTAMFAQAGLAYAGNGRGTVHVLALVRA